MSDEQALFTATYSDWKLVKGRKVVSISFEVPMEASDHAYNVLNGMPNFGAEQWFAIARLDPSKVKA